MTRLLQDLAAGQAAVRGGAHALLLGDATLSYERLEADGNRLAQQLVAAGCERGDRVCLLMAKTPDAVVAMHGTLKADCAYVPLDLDSPIARTARIVAAAEPAVVLCDTAGAGQVEDLRATVGGDWRVGYVGADTPAPADPDFGPEATAAHDAEPLPRRNGPDDIAHILFTSGSTGDPKGVPILHRNALAFVDWAVGHFGTRPDDRVSGHPPLHFDLSTFDIYATLSVGAELHLVPAKAGVHPAGLARFIRERRLTQWFSVPSALTYMVKFGAIAQDDFPEIERLLWCGEVLPPPILHELMRLLPHARFTNLYGPTEATIASSWHEVAELPADPTTPIPIGVACGGEELLIVDEGRPCQPDEQGEICIAGAGLSPGYWRDSEKTAGVFVADPRPGAGAGDRIYRTGDLGRIDADGVCHFDGRLDSQVKTRGYRVELGEIETALGAIEGLREYAVVGVATDGFEGTAICCAYSADGEDPGARLLRRELADALPSYMLPGRWMALDALPKNVNGKIDRRALRERFEQEAA